MRARSTMQARLSAATIEPEPMWAPAARSAANSYGVSAKAAGRMPPEGPPTRIAFRSRSDSLPARAGEAGRAAGRGVGWWGHGPEVARRVLSSGCTAPEAVGAEFLCPWAWL